MDFLQNICTHQCRIMPVKISNIFAKSKIIFRPKIVKTEFWGMKIYLLQRNFFENMQKIQL